MAEPHRGKGYWTPEQQAETERRLAEAREGSRRAAARKISDTEAEWVVKRARRAHPSDKVAAGLLGRLVDPPRQAAPRSKRVP